MSKQNKTKETLPLQCSPLELLSTHLDHQLYWRFLH